MHGIAHAGVDVGDVVAAVLMQANCGALPATIAEDELPIPALSVTRSAVTMLVRTQCVRNESRTRTDRKS